MPSYNKKICIKLVRQQFKHIIGTLFQRERVCMVLPGFSMHIFTNTLTITGTLSINGYHVLFSQNIYKLFLLFTVIYFFQGISVLINNLYI